MIKEGADLIRLLEEDNLSTEGIIRSPERITYRKATDFIGWPAIAPHRFRNGNRFGRARKPALNSDDTQQLLEIADVVIFQDYDKGVLGEHNIAELISLAQQKKFHSGRSEEKEFSSVQRLLFI